MADTPKREQRPNERGGELLARTSTAMVQALRDFFGKGPTQAKSYMLDDMLIIVMRGGLTRAERTMLDFGHPDMVREFRQLFENDMTERLIGTMEELTGRNIVTYQSQIMFDPDVVVEMFVFDSEGSSDAMEATAKGQLADDDAGLTRDTD